MFRSRHTLKLFTLLAPLALTSLISTGFTAGFEKTMGWSGKWNGLGGAATAGVTGAESLYFNPAGLAAGKRNEVTLNVSPTFSDFDGQIVTNSTASFSVADQKSTQQVSPIYGGLASYKVNDKLGIAIGAYLAGGSKSIYDNISGQPLLDYHTDLALNEISAGFGYELMQGLRLGAAYRIALASANLVQGVDLTAGNFGQVSWTDLKQTSYSGFRLGLQYEASNWGLGVSYRGKTALTLDGTSTMQVNAGTVSKPGSVSTELPQQISIGAYCTAMEKLKVFTEYSLTNYKNVASVATSTTLTGGDVAGFGAAGTALLNSMNAGIPTNWNNQHVGRLGFEYTGVQGYDLRLGYAITSQVVPSPNAKATFSSPGIGNSFTLGAGHNLGADLMLNLALEYSMASGTVSAADASGTTPAGNYSTKAYAAHVGATYQF